MSKIYTKTGDSGETGLVNGKRISKADPRIDLYGDVDDLNSKIGYSISHLNLNPKFSSIGIFLERIQCALFDLGSNLACEAGFRTKFNLPQIHLDLVLELEANIDTLVTSLPPLTNFILPGGSLTASSLHLCRTSARSCERKLVSFQILTKEDIPDNSLIFLNRLSDYFFVLSRYVNKEEGIKEIVWKKSQ